MHGSISQSGRRGGELVCESDRRSIIDGQLGTHKIGCDSHGSSQIQRTQLVARIRDGVDKVGDLFGRRDGGAHLRGRASGDSSDDLPVVSSPVQAIVAHERRHVGGGAVGRGELDCADVGRRVV